MNVHVSQSVLINPPLDIYDLEEEIMDAIDMASILDRLLLAVFDKSKAQAAEDNNMYHVEYSEAGHILFAIHHLIQMLKKTKDKWEQAIPKAA